MVFLEGVSWCHGVISNRYIGLILFTNITPWRQVISFLGPLRCMALGSREKPWEFWLLKSSNLKHCNERRTCDYSLTMDSHLINEVFTKNSAKETTTQMKTTKQRTNGMSRT